MVIIKLTNKARLILMNFSYSNPIYLRVMDSPRVVAYQLGPLHQLDYKECFTSYQHSRIV
ncbi:MAG: hypothetical protein ACRCUH_08830 [Shewanella sp.]